VSRSNVITLKGVSLVTLSVDGKPAVDVQGLHNTRVWVGGRPAVIVQGGVVDNETLELLGVKKA